MLASKLGSLFYVLLQCAHCAVMVCGQVLDNVGSGRGKAASRLSNIFGETHGASRLLLLLLLLLMLLLLSLLLLPPPSFDRYL